MDRKAKATKKRQKLNLKEANGYKAEADNFAPQEQPIGKVNTEKASKLNHFAPAACSPPPCLSSISTPVWRHLCFYFSQVFKSKSGELASAHLAVDTLGAAEGGSNISDDAENFDQLYK